MLNRALDLNVRPSTAEFGESTLPRGPHDTTQLSPLPPSSFDAKVTSPYCTSLTSTPEEKTDV